MMNINSNLAVKQEKQNRFTTAIASTPKEKEQCLSLRYEVFATEMGADLGKDIRLDKDRFDDYCRHLMVIDNLSRKVVATTRLLVDTDIIHTGCFYSETEFEISRIINLPGKFMEVGRTCIHPDYRKGSVLALLWQGIARIVSLSKIDYLIGCASIPLSSGDQYINSLMHVLRNRHYSENGQRVRPLVPLTLSPTPVSEDVIMPTLLKAYIRQGAVICGEPYLDAGFGVADVFILMDCDKITSRYKKHFINRAWG